jgi:hypothetical protein
MNSVWLFNPPPLGSPLFLAAVGLAALIFALSLARLRLSPSYRLPSSRRPSYWLPSSRRPSYSQLPSQPGLLLGLTTLSSAWQQPFLRLPLASHSSPAAAFFDIGFDAHFSAAALCLMALSLLAALVGSATLFSAVGVLAFTLLSA